MSTPSPVYGPIVVTTSKLSTFARENYPRELPRQTSRMDLTKNPSPIEIFFEVVEGRGGCQKCFFDFSIKKIIKMFWILRKYPPKKQKFNIKRNFIQTFLLKLCP